jgi:hypothetical protein
MFFKAEKLVSMVLSFSMVDGVAENELRIAANALLMVVADAPI